MEKISILVVDDDTLMRDTLLAKLEAEPFVNTVHEAWNESTFLQIVNNHELDIVLLDMKLPNTTGLELFKKLGSLGKQPNVIAFTGLSGAPVVINFMKAGVDGMLFKHEGYSELFNAINGVLLYGGYFSKAVKKIVKANMQRWDKIPPVVLTEHEVDLLKLIGEGLTGKQIGKAFKMTPGSVTKFKGKLMEKLGVRNVSQLLIFACQNGIL